MFSPPSAYWPHTPAFEQERKRRGRGQEHSRWINAPHPAAHVLGKQGRGLREGSLFISFVFVSFCFVVRGRFCSSMFFVVLISFVVVPCCSLSFSLCHFSFFPFFVFFCMRTRSRQWLHYSFFIIVCRLWSVVFIPPFFSCSYYVVHCRFPSVILLSFLGDFLVSFLFTAVLSFGPVFFGCVCFKKKRFVSMSVCVLCLMVWSV